MASIPAIKLPWWLKTVLWAIKFLPVPMWIKLVSSFLEKLIENLPETSQAQARAEKHEAVQAATQQGSHQPIHEWVNKHCSGVACPPDLVS